MTVDLSVGCAGLRDFEEPLQRHLERLSLDCHLPEFLEGRDEVAYLSLGNSASVSMFLRHTAAVEGYPDDESAFQAFQRRRSRFENMPWWENSIWLPLDFGEVSTTQEDPTLFVGSCTALLRELADLRELSFEMLDQTPPGYDLMRADLAAFHTEQSSQVLDEADVLRWVWRGLRDGAELAVTWATPMWIGPG